MSRRSYNFAVRGLRKHHRAKHTCASVPCPGLLARGMRQRKFGLHESTSLCAPRWESGSPSLAGTCRGIEAPPPNCSSRLSESAYRVHPISPISVQIGSLRVRPNRVPCDLKQPGFPIRTRESRSNRADSAAVVGPRSRPEVAGSNPAPATKCESAGQGPFPRNPGGVLWLFLCGPSPHGVRDRSRR